eukprot:9861079-Alexandrium_andersonii.AAC.1
MLGPKATALSAPGARECPGPSDGARAGPPGGRYLRGGARARGPVRSGRWGRGGAARGAAC